MPEQNAEVVRRWWQGFNEDGVPPLELCDEDVEIRNPPEFLVRGLFKGHDGVRRWCEQVWDIFDDVRVEPEEIIDVPGEGETVLMMLRATGKAAASGIALELEWAAIWTIQNGRMTTAQGYLRRAEALEAAGLPG